MPLQLNNATPFTCGRYALTAKNGATFLRVVLKGSFDILGNGATTTSDEQPEIVMEDKYWGAPGASSVRYESDLLLGKPGADLVIHGDACAPRGRPVTKMLVGVSYDGRVLKQLHVSGDREWRRSVLGWSPSSPQPFVRMPIVYDRAYGGSDKDGSEPRNRSGVGYVTHRGDLEGQPVANVESPRELIASPSDRPAPIGLGVVSRHWMPRMQYAGTYDQAWLDGQFPLLPADFDDRFFQSVAPDQWIAPPRGGEQIVIHGMSAEAPLHVTLPSCVVALRLRYADDFQERAMQPETVLVDASTRRCTITWGASADIHGDPFRLREICIGDPLASPAACCAGPARAFAEA